MLGSKAYTKGVDIWAVGAILGEMINGRTIFPGTSTLNQIERILEVLNIPTNEDMAAIQSPFVLTMITTITDEKTLQFKTLEQVFPAASAEALDVIRYVLCCLFSLNNDKYTNNRNVH